MSYDQGYAHSGAFAALKSTREAIPLNLTTPQYMKALDDLLQLAYLPLIQHTNAFESYLWQVVGWQEAHRRRKVSFMSRDDFILAALYWQSLPVKDDRVRLAPALKLDRAILVDFVHCWLKSLEQYELACNGQYCINGVPAPLDMQRGYKVRIESHYGTSRPLIGLIRDTRIWLDRYLELYCAVLQKYYRHCITKAQQDYASPQVFNKSIRLSDIAQVYVIAAMRAVDKCDPRQGVLTTQVNFWCMSARTSLKSERRAAQSQVPLPDEPDENQQDPNPNPMESMLKDTDDTRVQELARIVDPVGYGRAYLGMCEPPSRIATALAPLL